MSASWSWRGSMKALRSTAARDVVATTPLLAVQMAGCRAARIQRRVWDEPGCDGRSDWTPQYSARARSRGARSRRDAARSISVRDGGAELAVRRPLLLVVRQALVVCDVVVVTPAAA